MTNFAIIQTGGKQYKVSPGQKIKIEKLNVNEGDNFVFDKVLLTIEGENVKIGAPYIEGAKVEGKILRQARDKKKIVFKYHSKTRYRKKKGHRQHYTEVLISSFQRRSECFFVGEFNFSASRYPASQAGYFFRETFQFFGDYH